MKKLLSFAFVLIIFRQQFFSLFQGVAGSDWPYFYTEQLDTFPIIPYAWQTQIGLGGPQLTPWIDTYLFAIVNVFTKGLHIPWEITQLIFFFFFAILLSLFSSMFLGKVILGIYSPITSLVYTTNTYFLLTLSGGQLGVALSFATAPLVFGCFVQTIRLLSKGRETIPKQVISWLIYTSFALSLQILFDPRITYVTLGAIIIYGLVYYFLIQKIFFMRLFRDFGVFLLIPLVVSMLLHSYWILPLVLSGITKSIGFTEAIRGVSGITFYSFGSFSQALAFLHPNWPENIFGKTYFLQPEFILLPVLVFSGIFFLLKDQKQKAMLLPFYVIALIGIFFSKGSNEPFGGIYIWFYQHVPGFVFFRDPTKFYVLIAIAYSVLIPYFFTQLTTWILRYRKYVFILFSIFWLLTIRNAVFGSIPNTKASSEAPKEYIQLKNFLFGDTSFSRTLWIPGTQRFTFYSTTHPAISAIDYFDMYEPLKIARRLKEVSVLEAIRISGVKYIIVPFDTEGRLFQTDRSYDDRKYQQTVAILQSIHELSLTKRFGKITIFTIADGKDKFFHPHEKIRLQWSIISPVSYQITSSGVKSFIFSESFNSNWQAIAGNEIVNAENYKKLNRFTFSQAYKSVHVYFPPQRFVNIGVFLSSVTFVSLIFILVKYRKK